MKNIEWADRPWNPVTGCERDCKWYLANGRVVGCYARAMSNRFHLQPNFNEPQFHPARLRQPYNWRRSQRVFVCSTSDLYGERVPLRWLRQIYEVMEQNPHHLYLSLTKNYRYMSRMRPPASLYQGISVTNDQQVAQVIQALDHLPPVWWMSLEPLWIRPHAIDELRVLVTMANSIVIGALSSGAVKHQPDADVAREVVITARQHNIPVFLKPNLDHKALGLPLLRELPAPENWRKTR